MLPMDNLNKSTRVDSLSNVRDSYKCKVPQGLEHLPYQIATDDAWQGYRNRVVCNSATEGFFHL